MQRRAPHPGRRGHVGHARAGVALEQRGRGAEDPLPPALGVRAPRAGARFATWRRWLTSVRVAHPQETIPEWGTMFRPLASAINGLRSGRKWYKKAHNACHRIQWIHY